MVAPRLPRTLLVAAVLHAAIAASLRFVDPRPLRIAAPIDTSIELENEPPVAESPTDHETMAVQAPVAAARPFSRVPSTGRTSLEPTHAEPSAPDTWEAPSVSASAAPSATPPTDLGIRDYWKRVASAPAPASAQAENLTAPSGARVEQSIRDALNARDVERGLGAGGPIVTAAHEAGSSAIAPDAGTATFAIESDATGQVRSVQVSSFQGGDARRWNDVARALQALLTPKKLRVTSAGSGLRVRLRMSIERVRPSGEKVTTNLGAVPDDVPGSDPVCVGVGLARKCLKGLPIGVTVQAADITNAGASASRIVRAQILAEERL